MNEQNAIEETMPAVIFDTNIFDELLKEDNLDKLPKNAEYFSTQIQHKELQNNPNENRESLLALFNTVTKIKSVDQHWFTFDTSNFHEIRFCSSEEENDLKILANGKAKHINDALTILTAKSRNSILVTQDQKNPMKKAKELGYKVLTFSEFIREYS